MSAAIWKAFWEDNVDKLQSLLAPAGYNAQAVSRSPNVGAGGASYTGLGTSPRTGPKSRKVSGPATGFGSTKQNGAYIGKAEINSRDHAGLTVLLRAASSTADTALAFVEVLLDHPAIDIYVQDPESGWNALHRALYVGNISIARLLLEKERKIFSGQMVGAPIRRVGQLIKTKDHEGNSPFDLYNSTVGERTNLLSDGSAASDVDSDDEDVMLQERQMFVAPSRVIKTT